MARCPMLPALWVLQPVPRASRHPATRCRRRQWSRSARPRVRPTPRSRVHLRTAPSSHRTRASIRVDGESLHDRCHAGLRACAQPSVQDPQSVTLQKRNRHSDIRGGYQSVAAAAITVESGHGCVEPGAGHGAVFVAVTLLVKRVDVPGTVPRQPANQRCSRIEVKYPGPQVLLIIRLLAAHDFEKLGFIRFAAPQPFPIQTVSVTAPS